MKLSEAILLGSMLRPQLEGKVWTERGSCALGAAEEALGTTGEALGTTEERPVTSGILYQWLNQPGTCPECRNPTRSPGRRVTRTSALMGFVQRVAWLDPPRKERPAVSSL